MPRNRLRATWRPVEISTPRDEGEVEQEAVAAAEAVQQNVQEVRQNFIKQEFNANLFYAQIGGQQGMPANLPPAAPQGMQVDGSGQEVKPPPPKATAPQPSDSGVFTPQRQPDQRPPGGGSAPAPTPVDAEMKREEPDKKRQAEGQGDAGRPPRVPQERPQRQPAQPKPEDIPVEASGRGAKKKITQTIEKTQTDRLPAKGAARERALEKEEKQEEKLSLIHI